MTPGDLRTEVFERDGYKCRYCGTRGNQEKPLHVDHVYPLSKGGETTLDNLVTSCIPCNMAKRNKVGIWPKPIGYFDNPINRLFARIAEAIKPEKIVIDEPEARQSITEQIDPNILPIRSNKPVIQSGDEWFWFGSIDYGRSSAIGGKLITLHNAGIDISQFFTRDGELRKDLAARELELLEACKKNTD